MSAVEMTEDSDANSASSSALTNPVVLAAVVVSWTVTFIVTIGGIALIVYCKKKRKKEGDIVIDCESEHVLNYPKPLPNDPVMFRARSTSNSDDKSPKSSQKEKTDVKPEKQTVDVASTEKSDSLKRKEGTSLTQRSDEQDVPSFVVGKAVTPRKKGVITDESVDQTTTQKSFSKLTLTTNSVAPDTKTKETDTEKDKAQELKDELPKVDVMTGQSNQKDTRSVVRSPTSVSPTQRSTIRVIGEKPDKAIVDSTQASSPLPATTRNSVRSPGF